MFISQPARVVFFAYFEHLQLKRVCLFLYPPPHPTHQHSPAFFFGRPQFFFKCQPASSSFHLSVKTRVETKKKNVFRVRNRRNAIGVVETKKKTKQKFIVFFCGPIDSIRHSRLPFGTYLESIKKNDRILIRIKAFRAPRARK